MRGSTGINLGNLISGAVVLALNISISPGWLAGWRSWSWTCDGQQLGREGGEEGMLGAEARHVLTNRLV